MDAASEGIGQAREESLLVVGEGGRAGRRSAAVDDARDAAARVIAGRRGLDPETPIAVMRPRSSSTIVMLRPSGLVNTFVRLSAV